MWRGIFSSSFWVVSLLTVHSRVEGNSLAAIHRIKGIKEETIMKWLEKASTHVKQFERLVREKKLSCVQLDALWTYVWHKGEKGANLKKIQEELFGLGEP